MERATVVSIYEWYICRMNEKLSIKQEKFCNYYLECGNASEAYRRAFSCDRMSDKSIWEKASILLAKAKVRARVDELRDEMRRRSDITKDEPIMGNLRLNRLRVNRWTTYRFESMRLKNAPKKRKPAHE